MEVARRFDARGVVLLSYVAGANAGGETVPWTRIVELASTGYELALVEVSHALWD